MSDEKTTTIEEDEIDLLQLLGVLWKYKWLVIIVTFLAAAAAVTLSIVSLKLPPEKNFLPNMYTPSALLLVNEKSDSGLSSLISSSGLGSLAGLAGVSTGGGYGDLAVKLATGRTIVDDLIVEFDLTTRYEIKESIVTNTRKAFLSHFKASYDDSVNTISISFEDYDPEFARDVVNKAVELIDLRFASIGTNRNLTQFNLLEKKLAEVKIEITRLETEIQAFQTKYGVLDVESIATAQITILAELRSKLILKEVEINTYAEFSKIDDPVMKRLKTERDNYSTLIGEVEKGYSEYRQTMPAMKDLPALALEFEHLKRDLLVQGKIFELLTQQYEATKLTLEGEGPMFQVLELAEVPDKKSGPGRGLLCAIVTAAAFFGSVILVFVVNAVRNIRKDPERIRRFRNV